MDFPVGKSGDDDHHCESVGRVIPGECKQTGFGRGGVHFGSSAGSAVSVRNSILQDELPFLKGS